ncbi:GNAT family N-acetyltransferase [Rhodoferax sp. BLA1]|uniref:GNAT family N-acetyltransferase n=1 Tax=Rhodoferax sp. BLA1 TaxID=2576062 RepID=UPI0015D40052|nr:GNAT family N-acetyltransferase [Rhodoferax sp. BLA1]
MQDAQADACWLDSDIINQVMDIQVHFRPYSRTERETCLGLFDANCPEFFAPGERADYASFLDTSSACYELCLVQGQVVGAFGLTGHERLRRSLSWILLHPSSQDMGIGTAVMARVIRLAISLGLELVAIAASHKSAPFFTKFGAVIHGFISDGWGPGMHRVDMGLAIQRPNRSLRPQLLRGSV